MPIDAVYLKHNVMSEPVINQWYAWLLLYYPGTAGLVICNSHIKIMNSYLQSPKIHVDAANNPALLGGPFIDHKVERFNQIEELLEQTEKDHADLIEFAQSIKMLEQILTEGAKGGSMLPFYEKIPPDLQGFVELVYDLSLNASFRFIEGLLYGSSYFKKSSQAVILSEINHDHRSFALSTPRLITENKLQLNLPFDDERLDDLYALKTQPSSFDRVANLFEIGESDRKLFQSFFSHEEPQEKKDKEYCGEDIRIRYFGHACVLIQVKGVSILVDPVISYAYDSDIFRYTYDDLPASIDYLLFTHAHQDHLMFEHLLQLRHKVKTVIVPKNGNGQLQDPCLKTFFKKFGYKDVRDISEMEEIDINIGKIIGIPFLGEHGDLNIQSKIAYVLNMNDKNIMLAADSNNISPALYQHAKKQIGNIDILFIGMECDGAPLSWIYGSILLNPISRGHDQSRRLDGSNFSRAKEIVDTFDCQQVYVYAMGQEPWLNYVMCVKYEENSTPIVESNKLVSYCKEKNIQSERLFGSKELYL